MGSPSNECERQLDEDQHQVTLTNVFSIMQHEVTQGEFKSVVGTNPSHFASCGSTCPVEMVTWHMAADYCNRLSTKSGLAPCYTCNGTAASMLCDTKPKFLGTKIYTCKGYRLPTDAEWEYAYRGGTQTPFYNGTNCSYNWDMGVPKDPNADQIAWYDYTANKKTHPGGGKLANPWGLHDMSGNVYEWIHDRYAKSLGKIHVVNPCVEKSGTYRGMRGGSYSKPPMYLRAANRASYDDVKQYGEVGFRCVIRH